jgi:hypothetical protein
MRLAVETEARPSSSSAIRQRIEIGKLYLLSAQLRPCGDNTSFHVRQATRFLQPSRQNLPSDDCLAGSSLAPIEFFPVSL